jgi:hypothetical protein
VVKALYGLTEAGDYWACTLAEHSEADLLMAPLTVDHALYFRRFADRALAFVGIVCRRHTTFGSG